MRSVNTVTLIGNTGNSPDVRTTATGNTVANLSLATSYKRGDEEVTDWHRLVFFGKVADIVQQYVKKGDRLYVQGRVQYGSYEKDGVKIPTTEIVVNELVMLSSKNSQSDDDLGF
jgi:single-strand DNA-binding protein